jgi:hypothetical protein
MYHKRLICQLSHVLLVAGCAATVQRQDGSAPVPVGTKAPGKHVVLNPVRAMCHEILGEVSAH